MIENGTFVKSETNIISNLPPSYQKYSLILFLICMCAYYYFSNNEAPFFGGDTTQYLEVAQDIEDFRIDKIHYRSIGFPILLVSTGSAHIPSKLFFLLSLILYFVCLYIIALYFLKLKFKFTLIFLMTIVLTLPLFVQNSTVVMSENFTTFTLLLGFVFFVKGFFKKDNLYLILSGLFWGFTSLIRPTFQLLIFPVLLTVFFYLYLSERGKFYLTLKNTFNRSILFIMGFAFLIFLNCSINSILFNYFGLTPLLGITLSTRTVNFVEELPDNYKKEREILVKHRDRSLIRGKSHTGLVFIEDAIPELMDSTGLDFVQLSKHMGKLNLILIKNAPIKYLRMVGISGVTYWFPFATELVAHNRIIEYLNILVWTITVTLFFLQSIFILVLIISTLFSLPLVNDYLQLFLHSHREYIFALIVLNVIIFYNFIITILLSVGEPRHRSPTDIFIVMSIFFVIGIYLKYKIFLKNKKQLIK